MKRGREMFIFLLIMVAVIIIGYFVGFKLTGEAALDVDLNISVGGPEIRVVDNSTLTFPSGPNTAGITDVIVNFSVYLGSGAENINDSTALANITFDDTRTNSSCAKYEYGGTTSNYTCNISMWWWDGAGTWNITAFIVDNQSNVAQNTTTDFVVGTNTAFSMGPTTLQWPGISPGATNQTSNNDPLLMNNTGNDVIDIGNISINATNLRGETIDTEALWAINFSSYWDTGGGACTGAACVECAGTQMTVGNYVNITIANLTKGNYTQNDNSTGQEQLWFCLRIAGTGLSTQAYSTVNESAWSVQIG